MCPKYPVTKIVPPASSSDWMLPSEPGFHDVAFPVFPLIAASPSRASPPIRLNEPPTYTTLPVAETADTQHLGFGFQRVAFPVLAPIAASPLRAASPT